MSENEKVQQLTPDELAQIGRVEKEFTYYNGACKVKMHTLNSRENLSALKHTLGIEDAIVKYDMMKKGTLIYCIDEYNGKVMDLKEKENLIYTIQPTLLEEMYDNYLSMIKEQDEMITTLKKN